MYIAVDARSFMCKSPRGEGRSIFRLYSEIKKIHPEWRIVFYGENAASITTQTIEFKKIGWRGYRLNLWESLYFPLTLFKDKPDLVHCTSSMAPLWLPSTRVMLTVHDIIPLLGYDEIKPRQKELFEKGLERGIKKAKSIIAVSHNTKNDILTHYPECKDRITVIYWGCDLDIQSYRYRTGQKFHPENTILVFGGGARRKNTEMAIRAFERAISTHPGLRLVIVGSGNEETRAKYRELAVDLGIDRVVEVMEYVADEKLREIMRNALCLLYPSLYEGFGLPIIEAMAMGVPVITSDRSSMKEISGEAALLVNPENPEDIADAVLSIARSRKLQLELTKKGFQNAKCYSWEECARKTIENLIEIA